MHEVMRHEILVHAYWRTFFFLRGYWRTYFDNTLSIFFDQLGTLFADNSTYFFQITIDFYLHVNSTKALAEMGTELGFFFLKLVYVTNPTGTCIPIYPSKTFGVVKLPTRMETRQLFTDRISATPFRSKIW